MPKLKTKSGTKKRFKVTGSGKIMAGPAGKRHGMIKRTPKQIRQKRGLSVMSEPDQKIVRKYMPYAR
ncbi:MULTISPECIES: 50S ribosomal protein L35 [Aquisalinus]|uniref:Large ribosomal subunit protein bL35 n=2 Tax=Aquisalinus TaxID=1795639 RepID=A0A8J2V3C5_9PROT|nr:MULTISPECIES: 50S ribosomal protein L35 [Aquisalinus]MBD0425640.1 50S ribosomal protein L35 [Aquisalinus flavus]NHK28073.1 50S ribosomal protein L35 [Aquisalinus luteolus]UNE48744.1 50S ribosomal protein L35 [Aquisalinus flavus]GGD14427.1 50S ribosomal protein L35 [Aquisalinus flavus]GGH97370.1 50S ribosomal protein L35 [Aquisalinus luteolus]